MFNFFLQSNDIFEEIDLDDERILTVEERFFNFMIVSKLRWSM